MIFDHFGKPKEVRSEPQEPLLTDDDLPFLQPSVSKCDGTGWAL
jgi:hypothetical protein